VEKGFSASDGSRQALRLTRVAQTIWRGEIADKTGIYMTIASTFISSGLNN
jgi:hypothetical protein